MEKEGCGVFRSNAPGLIAEELNNLHPLLRERVVVTSSLGEEGRSVVPDVDHCVERTARTPPRAPSSPPPRAGGPYVLYLPTVNLRLEHNPALAVAARLANRLGVPLLVLAVIPDDRYLGGGGGGGGGSVPCARSMPTVNPKAVYLTSRRLAFLIEALSECTPRWRDLGAAVLVRVHGGGGGAARPRGDRDGDEGGRGDVHFDEDHVALAVGADAVVTDEPFVRPHATLAERVEAACRRLAVPCLRVDGSTTVPPAAILRRRRSESEQTRGVEPDDGHGGGMDDIGGINYDGVPEKAWMWKSRTESRRAGHVAAAMGGHFDAPPLLVRADSEAGDFFRCTCGGGFRGGDGEDHGTRAPRAEDETTHARGGTRHCLAHHFPPSWTSSEAEAPGMRPWTALEVPGIEPPSGSGEGEEDDNGTTPAKAWALQWQGADPSVPPCRQTVGSYSAGMERWLRWIDRGGLKQYAKLRNDIRQPHAVSRMSCYLNFGIVSVFRLVHEAKTAKASGKSKFLDEVVMWREIGYAHTFSRGDYDRATSLPPWAVRYLDRRPPPPPSSWSSPACAGTDAPPPPGLAEMEAGDTGEPTWDAMQRYLVRTGELHNNARMTWGKTMLHWARRHPSQGGGGGGAGGVLRTLCRLNDRYALDGCAPPSYAGLLWCAGWGGAGGGAGGRIAEKPASRYRVGPEGFREAEVALLLPPTLTPGAAGDKRGGTILRYVSVVGIGQKRTATGARKAERTAQLSLTAAPASARAQGTCSNSVEKGMHQGDVKETKAKKRRKGKYKPQDGTLDQYFTSCKQSKGEQVDANLRSHSKKFL